MEIRWTEQASENLENIFTYISRESRQAAEKVVHGIFDRVQILVKNPHIGYTYASRSGRQTRIILYGHFKIIYLVKAEIIEIIGIYHGTMDIANFL